ncbi:MAG: hypothetical protein ACRDP1_01195 [Nocardioidaceae bacterium]
MSDTNDGAITATQQSPYPDELAMLVDRLVYKPNYQFSLTHTDRGQGSVGLTLCIRISTPDSYDESKQVAVMHYMPVPPAAYEVRSWTRWLLNQVLLVESHESCEFFRLRDGEKFHRPFAPNHGPGRDPYAIVEYATDKDRRTRYTGEVEPAGPDDDVFISSRVAS